MGAEQDRRRQRILLFLAAGLISMVMATGCRTLVGPPKDGSAYRLDQLESQLLDQAAEQLQKRDYVATLDSVDKAISCCRGRYSRRALEILETALAGPDNPIGRSSLTISCLKGMENPFSNPVTGDNARCRAMALNEIWTNEAEVQKLRGTVQTLEKQIEELKAVDLKPELPEPGGN